MRIFFGCVQGTTSRARSGDVARATRMRGSLTREDPTAQSSAHAGGRITGASGDGHGGTGLAYPHRGLLGHVYRDLGDT